MSPESVPDMKGSGGTVMAMTSGDIGRAPIRMSPKRGSPCISPAVPNGAPSSATRPTEMLVSDAQVWKAWTMSSCQAAVARELRFERLEQVARVAGDRSVPSGAKLRVRCMGSRQGSPTVDRTIRPSSCSQISDRDLVIGSSLNP